MIENTNYLAEFSKEVELTSEEVICFFGRILKMYKMHY